MVAGCKHCLAEGITEFGRIHLYRCHYELAVVDRAIARGMSVDDDVIRRVCDHEICFCVLHKALVAGCN